MKPSELEVGDVILYSKYNDRDYDKYEVEIKTVDGRVFIKRAGYTIEIREDSDWIFVRRQWSLSGLIKDFMKKIYDK